MSRSFIQAPPRQPVLYMCVGLPGSGKSTWARQQLRTKPAGEIVRVNKDELRAMMHGGQHAGAFTENQVVAVRDRVVVAALTAGRDVIVDDTNLATKHEDRLRQLAATYGAAFIVRSFLDVDVKECIARDAQRTGDAHVGADVIRRAARQLRSRRDPVDPLYPQPYMAPEGAPSVVLFDIDGTLAQITGDRAPHHFHRVGEDSPDEGAVALAQALLAVGERIVVFSGRSETCYEQTRAWLDEHVAPDLELYMRAEADRRDDDLVKFELFQEHVAGRYDVKFVVDDRTRVVTMWRRILGLKCFQAEQHDF